MTKITFGLVVYNEQELIRRCLESIKEVADEIILVHDGECSDQTLAIAGEYTNNVSVLPKQGGSDPHRIFIFNQAKNDWVFMIDADEFLSEGLKSFLKNVTLDKDLGAYSFKWPLWDGKRYVTMSNYRACLFNREKTWAIGLHNFSAQSVGSIKKIDCILEHQPKQNKVGWKRFSGQFKTRLDRDAKCFLVGFEKLDKFNGFLIPASFQSWYSNYINHPLFYAYFNFFRYLVGSLKNTWRDGFWGVWVSLQAAVYQYKLGHRINQLKKEK